MNYKLLLIFLTIIILLVLVKSLNSFHADFDCIGERGVAAHPECISPVYRQMFQTGQVRF